MLHSMVKSVQCVPQQNCVFFRLKWDNRFIFNIHLCNILVPIRRKLLIKMTYSKWKFYKTTFPTVLNWIKRKVKKTISDICISLKKRNWNFAKENCFFFSTNNLRLCTVIKQHWFIRPVLLNYMLGHSQLLRCLKCWIFTSWGDWNIE